MTTLSITRVSKQYPNTSQLAVDDISFDVNDGEVLVLVGPSGCGKTTTLRLIAGLERPDNGTIQLGDKVFASSLAYVPPERRGLGMVFQEHALFPHLSVFDNVAFGLRGKSKAEVHSAVTALLQLVDMERYAARYPHALSGGERQRVALARALAPRPSIVLLDEPFSSLDADMRKDVREMVRGVLKKMKATAMFVTHDQEEALFMGDRLAVFQGGHIEQVGTPEQIFHSSATRFVAEFMGNSSFINGNVSRDGIVTELGLLRQRAQLPDATVVDVAVRADDVDFHPYAAGNAIVTERQFLGVMNLYRLRMNSGMVLSAVREHTDILPVGERVEVFISARHPLCAFQGAQRVECN